MKESKQVHKFANVLTPRQPNFSRCSYFGNLRNILSYSAGTLDKSRSPTRHSCWTLLVATNLRLPRFCSAQGDIQCSLTIWPWNGRLAYVRNHILAGQGGAAIRQISECTFDSTRTNQGLVAAAGHCKSTTAKILFRSGRYLFLLMIWLRSGISFRLDLILSPWLWSHVSLEKLSDHFEAVDQ